jgi:hypothetical protein
MLRAVALGSILTVGALVESSTPAVRDAEQQIRLVNTIRLSGSFIVAQAVYADHERLFLGSYQGDLFVLRRDRKANFPLMETIHLGAPLTSVRGNEKNIYVTSRNGKLYTFAKTWPRLQLTEKMSLSTYGLTGLDITGGGLYVAKGQAASAASDSNLFISELNPGDTGLDVLSMRSYGENFVPNRTLVFDRQTLRPIGELPQPGPGHVSLSVRQNFIFMTTPGCCGRGIDIYDAVTLQHIQYIERSANSVAVAKASGTNYLIAGSEAGAIDLYEQKNGAYGFISTMNLRELTDFKGSEDIEIRSLWADPFDNLIFAGSSWGNDSNRPANLPSLFILELIQNSPPARPDPADLRAN